MQADETLIAQVLEGDAEAFEAILVRYADAVRRHVARMVRDETAADDLTQETFLRVWTRAEQWNGVGPFRAWLFRVATNLALNALRSSRRRRQRSLDVPTDPAGSTDEDDENYAPGWMIDAAALGPDAWAELAERRELCRRLIEGLPEDKRRVLRLLHEDQMDVRGVAESLGIPQGTVRSRLHYALKMLASEWARLASEWEDD